MCSYRAETWKVGADSFLGYSPRLNADFERHVELLLERVSTEGRVCESCHAFRERGLGCPTARTEVTLGVNAPQTGRPL